MTWFSFQLPWFESADQVEAAPIVQVPAPVAAPAQVAPVAVKPDLAKPQATEPVKTVVEDFATALNRGHIAIDGASGNGASSGFAIDAYLTNHHNIEVFLDISLKQPIFMRNRGRGQNMIVTKVYLHGGAYQSDGFRSFISLQPKVRTPVQFVAYCFDFEKDNPSKDEEFTRDALPNNLLPLLQSISNYDTLHPNEDVTVAGQVAIWLTQGVSIEDVRAKLDVNNAQEALAREFLDFEIVSPGERATIADEITNSIGMKLKLIPAGEFTMGSNASPRNLKAAGFVLPDRYNNSDEQPAHSVRITKPFYMGVHEVTRGQFAAFVSATGYQTDAEKDGQGGWGIAAAGTLGKKPEYNWKDNGISPTDSHPVINVSWNDSVGFINWLSEKEGKQYRLPTEAEWEYSCRAGSSTHFSTGDSLQSLEGFDNVMDASLKTAYKLDETQFQPFPFTDGFVHTSPVGRFKANKFGLYDMHGNVSEWCSDWYGADYYGSSPGSDPQGPSRGSYRVSRGGSWSGISATCRSAYRRDLDLDPTYRSLYYGFRLALSPSVK